MIVFLSCVSLSIFCCCYYREELYALGQFLNYEWKINNYHFLHTMYSLYNLCVSLFISLFFVSKNAKISGRQRYYDITYFFRDSSYIIRFPYKKGPRPIYHLKITTDNENEDVTSQILPFLGPDLNWHQQIYFPLLLGFSCLCFFIHGKKVATFSSHHPLPSIAVMNTSS